MFNKKNKPVLLEINPRQSGSIAISLVAGFKLIDDLVQLLGNKIKKSQKFINKVIIPYQSLKIIKMLKAIILERIDKTGVNIFKKPSQM